MWLRSPTHQGKYIFQHLSMNDGQVSLQEYSRTWFGRRPQFFSQMEDDLNFCIQEDIQRRRNNLTILHSTNQFKTMVVTLLWVMLYLAKNTVTISYNICLYMSNNPKQLKTTFVGVVLSVKKHHTTTTTPDVIKIRAVPGNLESWFSVCNLISNQLN